jgi:AraC-like DNA-binding protein
MLLVSLVEVDLMQPAGRLSNHGPRKHAHHELIFLLRGRYQSQIGQMAVDLSPGGFVLYPQGMEHLPQHNDGRNQTFILVIWHGDLPELHQLTGRDRHGRMLILLPWIKELMDAHRQQDADLLWALLLDDLLTGLAGDQEPGLDRLERIRRLLASNTHEQYRLPVLAAMAGITPTHLNRLFRQRHGVTPLQYQRRCRIERAVGLLHQSTMDCTKIAQEVGLTSSSSLSRLMRQATGRNPRTWRSGS